jgi:ABC-type sugar transport system substrate-binding protein
MRVLARFRSPRAAATVVLVAIALVALASVVGFASRSNGPAAAEYQYPVTICHSTHSAKNPWVVITVSSRSLPAHKAHGDTLVGPGGTCPGSPI